MPEILRSKFYVISDECAKRNEATLFESGIIYRYIDLSNTTWLNDKDVDKKKLEQNLVAIIQILSENYGESPRIRFTSFESASKFTLVSDVETKSPLVDIDATCSLIMTGLAVQLENDKVTVTNNQTLIGQNTISVDKF